MQPERVHGGEGHGEGGQEVRHRQVDHQNVPVRFRNELMPWTS